MLKQHVWNTAGASGGGGYIDELVQVGLNIDPQNADTGTATENLCERFFWPLHNANFNVMALLNAGGVMVERYEYTPYGGRTVFSHGWMLADFNNDGVVGQGDVDLVLAHWGGTSDADQVAEAGDNGLVGQYELALVLNNYGSALPNDPQVHHPTAGSFRGDPDSGVYGVALNDFGHQGLMHDEEIGKIYNRARILDPRLARFMQRDPLGYVDGMSAYEYEQSSPLKHLDPSGKMTDPWESKKSTFEDVMYIKRIGTSSDKTSHSTSCGKRTTCLKAGTGFSWQEEDAGAWSETAERKWVNGRCRITRYLHHYKFKEYRAKIKSSKLKGCWNYAFTGNCYCYYEFDKPVHEYIVVHKLEKQVIIGNPAIGSFSSKERCEGDNVALNYSQPPEHPGPRPPFTSPEYEHWLKKWKKYKEYYPFGGLPGDPEEPYEPRKPDPK